MKLQIKESLDNQDWIDVIEKNRDKIADELVDLAKDACGRPQMDLYLNEDGTTFVFDNIGGNSWINSDDCIVIWTTRGFEYTSIEDLADIYIDDFIRILDEYTSEDVEGYVVTWLYLNTDASECYDTIDDYINNESDEVKKDLIKHYTGAYADMVDDLASDMFDYTWANDIIDMRIKELERDLHRR